MQPTSKPQAQIQQVEQPREVRPMADVDMLAVIERRNQLLERILTYAIRSTHAGQWVDQGGKPYPTAPAAEVMARRCAVTIENVQTTKSPSQDDKGPFYLYIVTCTAALPGGYDSIQAVGTCSSRDSFLGTETQAGRLLSEIDEGNILKAAYSNMLVNAVTRLLGVRNLSWEQLAALGIDRDAVSKVEYHGGSRGGGSGKGTKSDPEIRWGKSKGKRVSELADTDLAYYLSKAKEDVAKNDPKWHSKNVEMHDALEAERIKRSAADKTTGGKTEKPAPPWDRIVALWPRQDMTWDGFTAFVKQTTGKSKDALDDNDVGLVQEALTYPAEESNP